MACGQSCCPGRFSSAGGVQTGMAPGCRPLPLPPLVYAGEVSAERELPASPRIGWTFTVAEPGHYVGFDLEAGDALVCIGMAPAEWTALSGPVDLSGYVTFSDAATELVPGVMSPSDKAKLNSIEVGANRYVLPKATDVLLGGVYVDPALDRASDNPVENRAVKRQLDEKANAADIDVITNADILRILTGG